MPTNWAKNSKEKEDAWTKAKRIFQNEKGYEPDSPEDFAYVMGIAKKIIGEAVMQYVADTADTMKKGPM